MEDPKYSKKVQKVLELHATMDKLARVYRNQQAVARQPLPKGSTREKDRNPKDHITPIKGEYDNGRRHPRTGRPLRSKDEYFKTLAANAWHKAMVAEDQFKLEFEKLKDLEKKQVLEAINN